MNVHVKAGSLADLATEALVVGVYEGEQTPAGLAAEVDGVVGGLIAAVLKAGDFKGKANATIVLHAPSAKVKRVALVGLGKPGEATLESLRQAAGKGTTALRDLGVKSLTVGLQAEAQRGWKAGGEAFDARQVAQAIAEGSLLSLFQMNDYRTRDRDELKSVDAVTFWAAEGEDALKAGVAEAQVLWDAITLTRTLVMHPSNVVTATRMAEDAVKACKEAGVAITVLEKADLEKLKMGCILGVNQGSVEPPKFIIMEHQGGAPGEAPIAIVGKGITFDTGGISIKPGEGMDKMKYDMAGGAATIAIMVAAGRLGIKKNLVGLVPCTDNMPSGSALKPGDVLTAYNGMTVEVLNTDAEGRLVLCDAISYAIKDKQAAAVIDMATLTGACVIALGMEAVGVLGNNQALVDQILKSGEKTGDRGWQMPLWKEYNELLRSDIADMKNIGGREAGTITAACFLQRFAGDTPWCHLDIAGTAWTEKEKPYRPKGPTGVPVRMVLDTIQNWPL